MAELKPLESLEVFRDVLKDPAAVAGDWKAAGGKVVGVRCLFVPEEIVWAAGMLPWPLYGTPEPVRLADAYFQSCSCEFARNLAIPSDSQSTDGSGGGVQHWRQRGSKLSGPPMMLPSMMGVSRWVWVAARPQRPQRAVIKKKWSATCLRRST